MAHLLSLCSGAGESRRLNSGAPWSPCSETREAAAVASPAHPSWGVAPACRSYRKARAAEDPAQPEVNLKEFSQVTQLVKNPPASAGDRSDTCSIPGSSISPGGEKGSPLQYHHPENPMGRGACRATVHRVAKGQSRLNMHTWLKINSTFFPIIKK